MLNWLGDALKGAVGSKPRPQAEKQHAELPVIRVALLAVAGGGSIPA